ncbi:hypothetical protein fugu_009435 [Takifugu bimaculatus]|uniref:PHD-type domain-containing protein n=1 Tax=Takifugu bimaculatus TaxID=433685 RepID=A0A4Z2AZ90_9TELE|nr:hypothetical protein fugu_009435 [Takifugu bimaculatus]
MAASAATASSSLGLCPNYAVICSFLERYGALLDLPELTFPQLERYLQDTSSVPKLLVDLHVKLLRKIGKSVSADRWEKYLVKVCQEFNTTWAWELEQKGYKEMQTECKAAILKYLCECQFDENVKFKTAINEEDPDKMRILPIGRDKDGQMYWFQLDQDDNVRVYVEEQDDLDGSSWKCIVKTRNDLAEVVALLKTQIDPELLKREQENMAESEKKENTEGEVKKSESSSDEDSRDGDVKCSVSQKVDWADNGVSQNSVIEGNVEAESCSEKPPADVNMCDKNLIIKKEPPDISDRKPNKETMAVSIKSENGEEVKTNGEVKKISPEGIQQALKTQEQAKIPLKKRGMKFSEDFDKNSNIIVPNPSLHHGNECAKTELAPEQAGKTLGVNDHVNGDVQAQAEKEPQSDSKPKETVRMEQENSPSEAKNEAEESDRTEGTKTTMKEGLIDTRGDIEGEKAETREPTDKPDVEMAEIQKGTSQEAKNAVKTAAEEMVTETNSAEAPEKVESSKVKTFDHGDAEGKASMASEKETSQHSEGTANSDGGIKEDSTVAGESKMWVEKPAGKEEPSHPSEGRNTVRQPDPRPSRTEEDGERKSLSSDNKDDANDKNAALPTLDPPAEANEDEEKLEEEMQNKAECKTKDGLSQTPSKPDAGNEDDKTEQQNKDEKKTEVCSLEETPVRTQARTKRPVHRRRAEVQMEDWPTDAESDANVGRSLRRSPRISRPTAKAVEIHDKVSQNTTPAEKPEDEKSAKEKEEEEELEEAKATQKKPREKKVDQEGQTKSKGRKRRRVRWSNTRTHRKKRSSEDDASDQESSEEEESEEEDDSDEDYKVERGRRRRNRNRERRSSDSSTSSDDDLPPNDDPCKHCGLPNHPELILLCDSCDSGYHTACLRPPLMIIPDGEWFCPPCQHKQLCDKLQEQLQNLDAALKKKERAERRKERLIYVGISVENIIAPSVEEEPKPEIIKEKKEVKKSKSWGRRSTRNKKSISYRFDEFDEAIEEAIEEDVKEAEGGGAGRGKDMSNITGHRGKDMSAILQADDGKENGQVPRPTAGQRRKKRRRLNDLDSDSTVDEEESEEEFCLSESSEEFVASDNESEAETGVESNHSEGSDTPHVTSRIRNVPQRRHSSRKRQRPSWYSDEEEESGEEEEDEIVTEGSSEFSDGDLDMSRRRSRRSRKAQVNYRETSESEGSQADTNRSKLKPRRRQESSDSEVSFSGDSEDESRGKRRAGSSEEDSREQRRRLALKRRRASEEDNSDDSSDDSSEEEDRPIRKRVNRIDSDDDDEEEDTWVAKEAAEKADEESNLAGSKLEPPSSNGQGRIKSPEGHPPAPARDQLTNTEPPKNAGVTPAAPLAPNGVSGQDVAGQEDDEDDLLGVTDLVDYVCNNEDL